MALDDELAEARLLGVDDDEEQLKQRLALVRWKFGARTYMEDAARAMNDALANVIKLGGHLKARPEGEMLIRGTPSYAEMIKALDKLVEYKRGLG